jgi:hypothetical protein
MSMFVSFVRFTLFVASAAFLALCTTTPELRSLPYLDLLIPFGMMVGVSAISYRSS